MNANFRIKIRQDGYERYERYCILMIIIIQLLQMGRSRYQPLLLVIAATFAIASAQQESESASQIHIVNSYNMNEIMKCFKSNPISCQLSEDWVLLFFNSNNSRQVETFEYLIPGFAIQIAYSKLQRTQGHFIYPNSAIIDCFTSGSLCQSIGSEDLPLVLYKTGNRKQPIRYKGYVTLSGLISFIKSHDPETSYLAELYSPEGDYLEFQDVSKKQSKRISKQWKTKLELIMNAKSIGDSDSSTNSYDQYEYMKQKTNQADDQIRQTTTLPKVDQKTPSTQYEQIEQQHGKKSNSQYRNIDQTGGHDKREQKRYQGAEEQVPNNQYARMEKQMEKNKTSTKDKSTKDKKKVSKKDTASEFIQAVNWASTKVVDGFAYVGFGGIVLDIVGWISYIIFFLLFAVICLIAS